MNETSSNSHCNLALRILVIATQHCLICLNLYFANGKIEVGLTFQQHFLMLFSFLINQTISEISKSCEYKVISKLKVIKNGGLHFL